MPDTEHRMDIREIENSLIHENAYLVKAVRCGSGYQVDVGLKILNVFEGVRGDSCGGGCVLEFELHPDDSTRFTAKYSFRCIPICLVVETEPRTEELIEPFQMSSGWFSVKNYDGWKLKSVFAQAVTGGKLVNIEIIRNPDDEDEFRPSVPQTTGPLTCLVSREATDD